MSTIQSVRPVTVRDKWTGAVQTSSGHGVHIPVTLLTDAGGTVWIVDWDDTVLAPKNAI
jgi:hypothetical protein